MPRHYRFVDGQKSEGIACRLVGHIPKVAPGKKTMRGLSFPFEKLRCGVDAQHFS
jgi:hypothetical protein